jgi:hypothetical protein
VVEEVNIVALGNGGIRIAKMFEKYEQYEVYKIGTNEQDSERSRKMPTFSNPEDYENKCPDFSDFFKEIQEEVMFVMVGSSEITGASLAVLQQLSHCKITVLYVRPDISLLSQKRFLQEKVTFNVFQEYARSGLFHKLYLLDNSVLETIIGETPLSQYHKKLNELISSTIHMINVYKHVEPILLTDAEIPDISKIATFGISDPKTGKENLFYNLSNVTNKFYYFSMSKNVLEKDGKLLQKIKGQVKEKLGDEMEGGFGVYQNEYTENYVYVEAHTHILQNLNLST